MPRSLASRFFIASLITLPAILVFFALSLDAAFRSSLVSGEQERLKTLSYLLLGEAFFFEQQLIMPEDFPDARFNQFNSGLYGLIIDESGEELWRSQSAELLETKPAAAVDINPGIDSFSSIDTIETPLFEYYYDVVFELDNGEQEKKLRFIVQHHQTEILAEQEAYRQQLWQSLVLIGVIIVVLQMIILRWGLKPLKILAKDLKHVESGKANALEGEYPTEIQAVTDNLNQVLASERQQRQRYRNTLDDLAHSLKTPLSVIKGSLSTSDSEELVADQVERMNQIISHQLQRAVVASPGTPGKTISVQAVAKRLLKSLDKVYSEKNISSALNIDDAIVFAGDERDLMEVLGNLTENAYKYGRSKLQISAVQKMAVIEISIEDDGPGVAEEERQTILKRGARADTASSGQGIGLAVAVDIISSYQGSLSIDQSCLGGAKFIITLPSNPAA